MAVETKIDFKAFQPATLSAAEKCRGYFRKDGLLPLAALFIASWYVPRHEERLHSS
jgi:hypothetical protein